MATGKNELALGGSTTGALTLSVPFGKGQPTTPAERFIVRMAKVKQMQRTCGGGLLALAQEHRQEASQAA